MEDMRYGEEGIHQGNKKNVQMTVIGGSFQVTLDCMNGGLSVQINASQQIISKSIF